MLAIDRFRAIQDARASGLVLDDGVRTLGGRALDSVVARVAASIGSRGKNKPGPAVAIVLERGVEFLASMLGVWQAGGYFVPLNPRWPKAVLEDLLRRSKPDVVIRHEGAEVAGANTLSIEEVLALRDEAVLAPKETTPDRLAYVIYTSGSTGTPKGVMISHGAYASYIDWVARYFEGYAGLHRLLLSAELTFDMALGDLAFALAFGTEVHVVRDPSNIPALYRVIVEREIDVLYAVPTTHNALFHFAKQKRGADLSRLELVLSGGDAFGIELIDAVVSQSPNAHFYNVYGPTEMTINCFAARLDDQVEHLRAKKRVPIGSPTSSLGFALLDEAGENVSEGEAGRLCVRGPQTMLGYQGDPTATERAFVQAPGEREGERLYDTGDLAVQDDDGQLYLLGRTDRLVKVRGYRVHPDEITRAARGHADVVEAVTFATAGEDVRLVLVVTSDRGAEVCDELLAHLADLLPAYMLPTRIDVIDKMPLNNAGKIDALALARAHAE